MRAFTARFTAGADTSNGSLLLLAFIRQRIHGLARNARRQTLALASAGLARAQADAIRLQLLKIGTVMWRNTRRVKRLVICLS